MRLDRLVQFVSDQRSTCRAMFSFILIFLACVIFIHGWNKNLYTGRLQDQASVGF